MVTPTLKTLKALAEEGHESSLAERSAYWKPKAAGASGVKRESRAREGGGQPPPTTELEGGGVTPFKVRMQQSKTPAGVCDYLRRGLRCDRPICSFSHDQVAGTAAQQQQQQALPPPPTPPPPPQQQQPQPAAAAGRGGAGGSRPCAVHLSKNHAPDGRGGGARGNGRNN